MPCCAACFADTAVAAFVSAHGDAEDEPCPHCGTSGVPQIDEGSLADLFTPVIAHQYCQASELTQIGHVDPIDVGETLADLIQSDFDVFAEAVADPQELLDSILAGGDDDPSEESFPTNELWCQRSEDIIHWSTGDYWAELDFAIRRRGHGLLIGDRFMGDPDAMRAYQVVLEMLGHVAADLAMSTALFRARRGADHDGESLAAPPPELARPSRGNMQGQPVLYLADSLETAVAEVRPSVGETVSIARFELREPARLADLTGRLYVSPFRDLAAFIRMQREREVCVALGARLAAPVQPADEARDYIPTQFLCAMIARAGLDGVRYQSSQRIEPRGHNVLLFDPASARQAESPVNVVVEAVSYRHCVARRS